MVAMRISTDQQERYIAIWAKAVDTQMHFNEMSVKSRQLGLTFVAAALGVAVVLLSRGDAFSFPIVIGGAIFQLHVAVLLTLGALLAIQAVKVLDLRVYHRMLRGAVTFGEDFEEIYMKEIFDLNCGMTQAISHYSRYDDAKTERGVDKKYEYSGKSRISAEEKIKRFYAMTTWFLVIGAALILFVTNLPGQNPVSSGEERAAVNSSIMHENAPAAVTDYSLVASIPWRSKEEDAALQIPDKIR